MNNNKYDTIFIAVIDFQWDNFIKCIIFNN